MRKPRALERKRGMILARGVLVVLLTVSVASFGGCSKSGAEGEGANGVLLAGQQCLNVPNCVSVDTEVRQLKGTESVLNLVCPENAPYLWNWDAERHRDVSINLRADTPRSATLHIVDNDAQDVSTFKIFLGCSPNDISGRSLRFTHVSSADTN